MITLKYIADITSQKFGFDIKEDTRERKFFYARCVYYKLCKTFFRKRYTLREIGLEVGSTDRASHATVINGLKNFDNGTLYKEHYVIYDELMVALYNTLINPDKERMMGDGEMKDFFINYIVSHSMIDDRALISKFRDNPVITRRSEILDGVLSSVSGLTNDQIIDLMESRIIPYKKMIKNEEEESSSRVPSSGGSERVLCAEY